MPGRTTNPPSIDWHVGTIAFTSGDWSGVFYPPAMRPADQLAFYARHFDVVEINSTFHAMPPPERFDRWADVTPRNFRFIVKTPRAITHDGVLSKALAPMRTFLSAARRLGEKLSCVVIQYPPTLPGRVWPQVERFLSQLPTSVRYAVEFRDDGFYREEIFDGLARMGIALVNADLAAQPREPIITADFTLVRLIGAHGKYEPENFERVDRTVDLAWWRDRLAADERLREAFVMIGNDYAGYAVGTADRFKRIVGQAVTSPQERMGLLF